MRILGSLTGGAGVATPFNGSFVHKYLQIGDGVSAPDIRGLQLAVGGNSTMTLNFANSNVLDVLFQMIAAITGSSDPTNANAPFLLQVASGFMPEQSLELNIVNDGAGTPEVRIHSDEPDGVPVIAGSTTLQASSQQFFSEFDILAFEDANFSDCTIKYANGHSENNIDADALRALAAAQGVVLPALVSAGTVAVIINNPKNPIQELTINSGAGGTLTVANVLFP